MAVDRNNYDIIDSITINISNVCAKWNLVLPFYGRDDQPYFISLTRNETEGDFEVEWHSTDPWRGYYQIKAKSTLWLIPLNY